MKVTKRVIITVNIYQVHTLDLDTLLNSLHTLLHFSPILNLYIRKLKLKEVK